MYPDGDALPAVTPLTYIPVNCLHQRCTDAGIGVDTKHLHMYLKTDTFKSVTATFMERDAGGRRARAWQCET